MVNIFYLENESRKMRRVEAKTRIFGNLLATEATKHVGAGHHHDIGATFVGEVHNVALLGAGVLRGEKTGAENRADGFERMDPIGFPALGGGDADEAQIAQLVGGVAVPMSVAMMTASTCPITSVGFSPDGGSASIWPHVRR